MGHYTKELNKNKTDMLGVGMWDIFDPEGNLICTVMYSMNADALLSHLNK